METDYVAAADLRKCIIERVLAWGVHPAECGRLPNPLYKSYWDCFHDKHLSLIIARSSAGQGGGNTATPLLVEAPSTYCNDTSTLEEIFCKSGNNQDCLDGMSNREEYESCLMDGYTRQLNQRRSSEHGQPYETLTKVENIPANPSNTCANEDKTPTARVSCAF